MAGYSSTPLTRKLGLKEGMHVLWMHAPEHLPALLPDRPAHLHILTAPELRRADFIHAFYTQYAPFAQELPLLRDSLRPTGMLWISWPKKSARVPSDLDENRIRDAALQAGLVDVKVCAVDDTWSGLKLVFRLQDR